MLKLIAIIAMTIDHIGHYFAYAYYSLIPYEYIFIMRTVGRLAMPIFCYYLALGFKRSRNIGQYALRLLLFAFASQLVISYAQSLIRMPDGNYNILFTFFLALVFLAAWELFSKSNHDLLVRLQPLEDCGSAPSLPHQYRFNLGFTLSPQAGRFLGGFFMLASLLVALFAQTDYDIYGVLFTFIFYLAEGKETRTAKWQFALLWAALLNLLFISLSFFAAVILETQLEFFAWSPLQGFAVLAVPLCYYLPQGTKRPALWQKYFFYVYYSSHILLICLLLAKLRPH